MQQVISRLQQDFEVTTQPRPECSFVCPSASSKLSISSGSSFNIMSGGGWGGGGGV